MKLLENERVNKNILTELDNSSNIDIYYNLFTEIAKEIERKYKINDLASKIDKSKIKVSKKYGDGELEFDYIVVTFLNCPLVISFDFDKETGKFFVRANLRNPDSMSIWVNSMKGKTLSWGKYVDGNIKYFKDRY